jgi:hypothetical protein
MAAKDRADHLAVPSQQTTMFFGIAPPRIPLLIITLLEEVMCL